MYSMNFKKTEGTSQIKGFTLIELLVVLAVTGTLTAIVITSAVVSRANARDLRRISDMKEIQLSLAVYYDVRKEYPIEDTGNYTAPLLVSGGYLKAWPTDPSSSGSGYRYKRDPSRKKYCLGVVLESKAPTDLEDHSTNPSCVITTTGFSPSAFYKVWR